MEEMLVLPDYKTYAGFSDREKAAIALAEELTRKPPQVTYDEEPLVVSEEIRAKIKQYFTEPELIELVMGIALFNLMNRFNRFLDPDLDVPPCPPQLMALLS